MAPITVTPWRLVLPEAMKAELFAHLFPGDNDEHGAIILAGVCQTDRGLKLVARELHLAIDGKDYVPGRHGYRMLKGEFIQSRILRARDLKLAYLAIHNHGGTTSVGFSSDDFASHERGYPSLVDISRGLPVGALVFARSAVAGDLWFEDKQRAPLKEAIVLGQRRELLYPSPLKTTQVRRLEFDRQSRLFGDAGQELLRSLRIGIIGLGGAGSILAELLGRLGIGEFVLADPDRAEVANLPRLIAARRMDAIIDWLPRGLRTRFARYKVEMAARNIRRANPSARIVALQANFLEPDVAKQLVDCDYLFLAADTMGARLLFNAIVHQHGVPGVQVGAKVPVSPSGEVGDVFCVARKVTPGHGCLWCNGLINPSRLQDEAVSDEARRGYAYVADPQVAAPSVITLNAIACSHAADDFLFQVTGLKNQDAQQDWFRWNSRKGTAGYDGPRRDLECLECSSVDDSRLGRGDFFPLPTRAK
ncbi:ThiF family adenylyltransferase [Bradyrhizobium sp. 200]|uniref:ThiF family adenylyltransferase n=1 Tax=Bradyrhizobium sp. 200 TaxID=2782665 RepID=UPI001FFE8834|nr:ThiF family adenylyltransferase [Bradyrhizobium sp. 200]UPJ47657.1 ThiF family adenylyltransferase [Bradyrhizobium sp. 200]